MADLPPYPGTPRWVKVSGIVVGVLVLLVVIIVFTGIGGPHGPGRHASPGEAGGHGGWGLLMLLGVLVAATVALNWGWLVDRGWRWWPRTAPAPMTMTPGIRKLVLAAHVTSSVGSLGAVAVFLALAVVGLTSQDGEMVRAACVANEFIAWYIILPLILAALLVGVIQSLGTQWGLFRHYWILVKFLLTAGATIVLLLHMEAVSRMSDLAAEAIFSSTDFRALRIQLVVHAAGGLMVLLAATTLSVYKPWGLTAYGRRKQHEWRKVSQTDLLSYPDSSSAPDQGFTTTTPRWVYVVGIHAIGLALLFVVLHLTGVSLRH